MSFQKTLFSNKCNCHDNIGRKCEPSFGRHREEPSCRLSASIDPGSSNGHRRSRFRPILRKLPTPGSCLGKLTLLVSWYYPLFRIHFWRTRARIMRRSPREPRRKRRYRVHPKLIPETRYLKSDTRNPILGIRYPKPDTRYPIPETCLPKPDTQNPDPETRGARWHQREGGGQALPHSASQVWERRRGILSVLARHPNL